MFFWDGVVSCLRAYSSREISSICHAACADTGGIEISSGVRRSLTFPAGVTWHILVPAKQKRSRSAQPLALSGFQSAE